MPLLQQAKDQIPKKSLGSSLSAPLSSLLPYTCAVRSQPEGNPGLIARGQLSSTTTTLNPKPFQEIFLVLPLAALGLGRAPAVPSEAPSQAEDGLGV